MNIIWIALLFLCVWTVAGCWYFIMNMGYKNKKEVWWEKALMSPVMPIAMILGFLLNRNKTNKKN